MKAWQHHSPHPTWMSRPRFSPSSRALRPRRRTGGCWRPGWWKRPRRWDGTQPSLNKHRLDCDVKADDRRHSEKCCDPKQWIKVWIIINLAILYTNDAVFEVLVLVLVFAWCLWVQTLMLLPPAEVTATSIRLAGWVGWSSLYWSFSFTRAKISPTRHERRLRMVTYEWSGV